MKPRLYLDVDDVLIANCHKGSGFDLRPSVLTQLRVLSRLYDCVWLTCWPRKNIFELIRYLYGSYINENMSYADWGHGHPWRKAGYVLDPRRIQDWWWLEDPLCQEELDALVKHNKLDRYIRVEPYGQWAFLDSVNELFRRSGVGEKDIKRVDGKPEWFQKEAILSDNSSQENIRETLSIVKFITNSTLLTPEDKLKRIQEYIQGQLDTLY